MKLTITAFAIIFTAMTAAAQPAPPSSAERLMARALESNGAWETLAYLTDHIGPRLSGSKGAAQAVDWTTGRFRAWGIDVRNEKVMVPHWVRGEERASLVSHNGQKIVLTALGGSVATPPQGITADVVEVANFDDLDRLGEKVRGKIVFYNNPMNMDLVRAGHSFDAYGEAVRYRGAGASRAAQYGAVASLIRSVASASLRDPHTGAMRYDPKFPKIPTAAMTVEDAMLVDRLIKQGERVRMHLLLTPKTLPDVESANVVAEIRGSERPDEIVLVGGHLDSWDLATGAIDDGSGVAMSMAVLRLVKELDLHPRRTIRCVLFMNEENGLRGGRGYAAAHKDEIAQHVAAIETDAGAAAPTGFSTSVTGERLTALDSHTHALLARVNAARFEQAADVGADISPLTDAGVPSFGLVPDPLHYFDYHHSPSDTLDKIDPKDLAADVAALAALTWEIADSTESLRAK